jgi:hypothetical protein
MVDTSSLGFQASPPPMAAGKKLTRVDTMRLNSPP